MKGNWRCVGNQTLGAKGTCTLFLLSSCESAQNSHEWSQIIVLKELFMVHVNNMHQTSGNMIEWCRLHHILLAVAHSCSLSWMWTLTSCVGGPVYEAIRIQWMEYCLPNMSAIAHYVYVFTFLKARKRLHTWWSGTEQTSKWWNRTDSTIFKHWHSTILCSQWSRV